MVSAKRRFLILSLVLLGSLSVNACNSSHWDDFLLKPDKDTLIALENIIEESPQLCSPAIAPMQKHRTQLFELIRGGNPSAFSAAMLVSECWDGGELEDFHRSAGIFFEAQPYIFVQIVNERAISDSQLRYMLTMLPLETVDQIDRKIAVVKNRIELLKNLNSEQFGEIKRKGLSFLEKRKEGLEGIRDELNKTK